MRDRPSRTAEMVCLFRALETLRPDAERVLTDPYAERFLPRRLRALVRAAALAPRLADRVERIADPGLMSFVLARHRELDERLLRALERGVEQVIVLGAGYDTRAWRFAEALAGRPIFEVDHPATSARKARQSARFHDLPQVDLRRVAVDFRRDELGARLGPSGFRRDRQTLILWEGVTMYLRAPEVAATLRAVRDLVGPGSELLADFWCQAPVSTGRRLVIDAGRGVVAWLQEPLRFELDPVDAPAFFAQSGWPVCGIVDAETLDHRYLSDGRRPLPRLYVAWLSTEAGSSFGGSAKI